MPSLGVYYSYEVRSARHDSEVGVSLFEVLSSSTSSILLFIVFTGLDYRKIEYIRP